MSNTDQQRPSNPQNSFQKAREGLWSSLQKHLDKLFELERPFIKSLPLVDAYPFNPSQVDSDKLAVYLSHRNSLKDLFIDETEQLDNLVKTIKQKNYREEDKKQLFLLILGYIDISESIFSGLEKYKPFSREKDEELENTLARFDKLKKFVRLNIKGILPKF